MGTPQDKALRLSCVGDRLRLRLHFAVSWNLPLSTAMLITRFLGGLSYAFGRCRIIKTRTPESIAEAVRFIHPDFTRLLGLRSAGPAVSSHAREGVDSCRNMFERRRCDTI